MSLPLPTYVPTILTLVGICLALLAPLLFAQCNAVTRPYTGKFTSLSYFNSETLEYGVGFGDNYLVLVLILLLTGLRDGTMRFILGPIASVWGLSRNKSMRFKEQAWLFIYYSTCCSVGTVCLQFHSPGFLLTSLVHLCYISILAGSQSHVDKLAKPRGVGPDEILYASSISLLVTADDRR